MYELYKREKINRLYCKLVLIVKKYDASINSILAFLLCLSPLLQHYKGPVVNAGFTVLFLLLPVVFLLFLVKWNAFDKKQAVLIIPLVVFALYKMFDHGATFKEFVYTLIVIFYFFAIGGGIIDSRLIIQKASFIATISCCLIILQYFCYYVIGFHLQLVPTSLLLPESSQWIPVVKTGLIEITGRAAGFYRPSSFFLEPSHMFLYLFPIQVLFLLSKDVNKSKLLVALLLSVGLVLSTSGMGIATTLGILTIFLFAKISSYNKKGLKRFFNLRVLVVICAIIGIFIISYFTIPFIRHTMARILRSNELGSNAILGRTSRGFRLIKKLKGAELWLGKADSIEGIKFNMSGFAATMYKYGVIGVVISYVYYVFGLVFLKREFFLLSSLIILVSFFSAHTHGTFYMFYYVSILMYGYRVGATSRFDTIYNRINHLVN